MNEGQRSGEGFGRLELPWTPDRPAISALEAEQTTAREALEKERDEVVARQGWLTGWLVAFGMGPMALVAVLLAIVTRRGDLILPFLLVGGGVQLWRLWHEGRRLRRIERELSDPMDGS